MLELKSLLGKGGHGVVFSCEQASLAPKNELDVLCLKIAPNTDPHAVELLELEDFHLNLMRACPYVPKVIAKGQLLLDGTPCLGLLTDVVGVPLPTLSKSQLQSILPHLWSEMCYVLGQIHSHGLVHCDVKPAHFVVNRSGLWLIDFGSSYHPLSRVLRQDTLYTTPMFSSPRCLNEDGSWPIAQDDIQSAAYSLISLLSPNGELPEGHQSHPTQLISLVPPQHRRMIRSVLYEARLVSDPAKRSSLSRLFAPPPKRRLRLPSPPNPNPNRRSRLHLSAPNPKRPSSGPKDTVLQKMRKHYSFL